MVARASRSVGVGVGEVMGGSYVLDADRGGATRNDLPGVPAPLDGASAPFFSRARVRTGAAADLRPADPRRYTPRPVPTNPAERMRLPRLAAVQRRALTLAAVATAAVAPAAHAQRPAPPAPVDSVQFRGLQWRSIGPNRGGRSIAVAGSARRPLEYYFGAVGGGLWKTTDGGTSWKPVTDGQIRSSSVGAVAVSESNPDVVYVGMGETCIRGNIMQGDGVYRSADGGKTWTHVGLAETHAISKIRIDPRNPDVVWV